MAPNDMSAEDRLDALAQALAKGFLDLADRGLLDFDKEPIAPSEGANQKPIASALLSGGNEGTPS